MVELLITILLCLSTGFSGTAIRAAACVSSPERQQCHLQVSPNTTDEKIEGESIEAGEEEEVDERTRQSRQRQRALSAGLTNFQANPYRQAGVRYSLLPKGTEKPATALRKGVILRL